MVHSSQALVIPTAQSAKPVLVRLTDAERAVLTVIGPDGGEYDWRAWSFAPLCEETGLERRIVRRACRSLTRKGLAAFEIGLWSEDWDRPAGAGYRSTAAGRQHFYSALLAEEATANAMGISALRGNEPSQNPLQEGVKP